MNEENWGEKSPNELPETATNFDEANWGEKCSQGSPELSCYEKGSQERNWAKECPDERLGPASGPRTP